MKTIRTASTIHSKKNYLRKNGHFLCLLFLAFVCSTSMLGQSLKAGDIISIKSSNNHLAVSTDGTAITNSTTLNNRCLWIVRGSTNSGYSFESLNNPGNFLYGANNYNLTIRATGTLFSFSEEKYLTYKGSTRGVGVNITTWQIRSQRNRATLTFEFFSLVKELTISPTYHKYTNVGNRNFTISWNESYKGDAGHTTPSVTTTVEASANPSFVLGGDNRFVIVSNTANTATVEANTGATSGRLVASAVRDGKTYIATAHLYYDVAFLHKPGMTGRALIDNGKGKFMQGTHTVHRVIYVAPGGNKRMEIPVNYNEGERIAAYYRWYNFGTDSAVIAARGEGRLYHANGNTSTTEINTHGYTVNDAFGRIKYNNTATVNPYTARYEAPSDANFKGITVACDVSNNTDYSVENGIITEPTLSYRLLYEIRNANEMASELSACTGDKFLEEFHIVAPYTAGTDAIRFGPQYRYKNPGTGGCTNYHNYYYLKNGVPTQITGNCKWTWSRVKDANGNPIENPTSTNYLAENIALTILDDRLLQTNHVNSEAQAGTWEYKLTYTDGGTTYNIAKIEVKYEPKPNIGPIRETNGKAIITQQELEDKYILLAQQRFDYNDGTSYVAGEKATYFYNKPLPWNDISYGFRYRDNRHTSRNNDWPNWSEYNLMRTASGLSTQYWVTSLTNRTGAKNGYFLYVDAGVPAEKIADLSIDGHLCSGTVLYFSAWVANLAKSGALPNLLFALTGYDAAGNATELERWTTGDVGSLGSSEWQQVFYEMPIKKEYDYKSYTIRVYNNGESATGNDFGFDDFQIYMKKMVSESLQLLSNCQASEDEATLILGVDYLKWFNENDPEWRDQILDADGNIIADSGWEGDELYYRWENLDQSPISTDNYLGNKGVTRDHGFVNLGLTLPQEKVYTDFSDFFSNIAGEVDESEYFFLLEEGAARPILYIVQRSVDFAVNSSYYTAIALNNTDLNNGECANKSLITIRQPSNIIIDGQVDVQQLCAGFEYPATIVFYTNDKDGKTIEGSGMVDWYQIDSNTTQEEVDELWKYIQLFREEYPEEASSFDKDVKGLYSQEAKNYLTGLSDEQRSKINLYTTSIQFELNEMVDKLLYYAFPIRKTIKSKEGNYDYIDENNNIGNKLIFCPNPVLVEFAPKTVGGIGDGNNNIPEEIAGEPTHVRLSLTEVTEGFDLPLFFTEDHQPEHSHSGYSYVDNNTLSLYETDDTTFDPETPFLLEVKNVQSEYPLATTEEGEFLLHSGDVLSIAPLDGQNFQLKEGYKYKFKSTLGMTMGAQTTCAVHILYFNLLIVPDTLYWSPAEFKDKEGNVVGVSKAWNKDENWYLRDSQTGEYRQGFVPKSHSSVVLPEKHVVLNNANPSWPILPSNNETNDTHATEAGATPYITYDLNYEKHHCKQIHFEPGAMLINQQNLVYEKAWVDLRMPTGRWEMLSVPMQEILSGDFYISGTTKAAKYFDELSGVDSRNSRYPFWQSIYNQEIQHLCSGKYEKIRSIGTIGWVPPANYLIQAYEPGHGFRIWAENGVDLNKQSTLRFPKRDAIYYYFNSYDKPTSDSETLTRSNKGYKLAYDVGADSYMEVEIESLEASNRFLVGNPLMAYLNLDAFFEANAHLKKTVYVNETGGDGTGSLEALTPDFSPDGSGNLRFRRNIPPMTSFFVELEDGTAKSVDIRFAASMGSYLREVGQSSSGPALRSTRPHNSNPGELRIEAKIGNITSKALLAELKGTSFGYVPDEDAELLVAELKNSTIAIYTIADNKPLNINVVPVVDLSCMIPLNFISSKPLANDCLEWIFKGGDSFFFPLHLYDSKTAISTPLNDETRLCLEMPTDGSIRYYIRAYGDHTSTQVQPSAVDLFVYNNKPNTALIYSTQQISKLSVINALGQLIINNVEVNSDHYEVQLPGKGVYIIQVSLPEGTINKKVLIK